MRRATIVAAGLGVLMAGLVVSALSQEEPVKDSKRLEDLTWLAGRWRSARGGNVWEETWSRPEGDSMVGVTRWVADGRTRLYELMVLEKEKDGPVYRMRHFNRGLVGWKSEQGGPLAMKVKSVEEGQLVLEDRESTFPRTITYRREKGTLDVVLEGEQEGKPKKIEFRFERAGD